MGPAASQIAIKQLGTNGGGFFNVNSAHPYENPTPLSDFLEMLSILLIAAALCYTFGRWSATPARAGRCSRPMTVIFVALLALCVWASTAATRAHPARASTPSRAPAAGGNMEGKEVRFGVANSRCGRPADDGGVERFGQRDARLRSRRSAGSSRSS
jgi:K+-transporting ATPase ATPase A chain